MTTFDQAIGLSSERGATAGHLKQLWVANRHEAPVTSGSPPRSTIQASYATMIDMNSVTVTVSPKFQVVIPLAVRRRMKLEPGAKLMVLEFNGGLRLMPLQPAVALRGIARGVKAVVEREPDRTL